MTRSAAAVAACTSCLLAAACASHDGAPAGPRAEPARFETLPRGWTQRNGGAGTPGRHGAHTWTLATSWPYAGVPHGPASVIPRGELFVSVLLIGDGTCDAARLDPRSLSLAGAARGRLEGRRRVRERRLSGCVRTDYLADIRIDFNRRHPGARMLARAQAALDRLVLPDWPD